jgi:hypothetical protein
MALSLSALQRSDNPTAVSISRGKVGRLLLAANDATSSAHRGLKKERVRVRDAARNVLASLKEENVKSSIIAQVEDLVLSLGDNSSSSTEAAAAATTTTRNQQQAPPPSSPVASRYAMDAIARLDQMQQELLTRSRCTSPMSPTPVSSASSAEACSRAAELAEAQETIRELEARNALLNKDLQLSLLALNKSSQSRQLAAAHAARSTKIQLAASLSEISPGFPVRTPPDVDDHVKRLTSRLDALQRELDKSLEEQQQRDREHAAKNAVAEKVLQSSQARVVDLERANLELTLKYTSRGADEERESLVRQIQLLDDLSSKSSRRVDTLAALVSKIKEQLTSSKSADATLKSLCSLLDLPPPAVTTKAPLVHASPLSSSSSSGGSMGRGKENSQPSAALKTPSHATGPAATSAKKSTPSPTLQQRFGVLTTISPLASLR